jgi:hypothetical protein
MKPKEGIPADFDRIEEDDDGEQWAVIFLDSGDHFDYPVKQLGAGCVAAGRVRVLVVKDEEEK